MSVKTIGGLNLYDPNENIGGNQFTSYGFGTNPDNNNAVNQEDLIMYCNLRAFTRPRSYIMNSNSDGVKTQAVASARINFLKPNKDKDKFTTDWTELDASGKPNGEEMLGINSVQITYDTSYVPRVTITMTDVRGQALNEDPKDSPYGAFFNFPYPMFVLEVKGYYGKAVKYLLHLLKYSSRFDYSTGNFQITCEFVGFTYALLSDLSVQYGLVASQMTLFGKTADERLVEKFKLQAKKYPDMSADIIAIVDNKLYTLINLINKSKDLSTFVESLGQDNKKFREKAALDNFIDVIQRLYDTIIRKEVIFNQLFNEQVANINADSLFTEFPEYKKDLTCNVKAPTDKVTEEISQTVKDSYIAYYNNSKNFITSKNTDIQKELDNQVRSELTRFLGFEPTIRNIMLIICNNFELFLDLLTETTQRAAENKDRNKKFIKLMQDGNPQRTDNQELELVYPWPALYNNDSYEVCYFDDLTGINTNDYPEKEFVEAFLNATQYTNKLLAITGTSSTISPEILNAVKFNPMHTQQYDSNNLKTPIFDNQITKILTEIVEHALLVSSNSYALGGDKQLLNFGKADADNLYKQLGNTGVESILSILRNNLNWITDKDSATEGKRGILQTINNNDNAIGDLTNPLNDLKLNFQYIKDYGSDYLTDIVETQDITKLKGKYSRLQGLRFVPEVTGNLLGVGDYGAGSVTTDPTNGFIYYEKIDDFSFPKEIFLRDFYLPFMETRQINDKDIKYINNQLLENNDLLLQSLLNVLKKIQQSGSVLGPEELLKNIPGITDDWDFVLMNGIHKTKMVRALSTLFFNDEYVSESNSANNGDKIKELYTKYTYYFPFTTEGTESYEKNLRYYTKNKLAFLSVYKELLINQLNKFTEDFTKEQINANPSLNDISELELYREKLGGAGFKVDKNGVVGLDPTTKDAFKKSVDNKAYVEIYADFKEFFETPIQMVAKSKSLSDIYKDPLKYWTNESQWNKTLANLPIKYIRYNNILYNVYNSGGLISFYLKGFQQRIAEIEKNVTESDKNNPQSGSNTAGVKTASDLKRSLYQTFKNINDKWVIDKIEGGKSTYAWGLEGDVDPNNNELKYNFNREYLFDHFYFVDRINRDIGSKVLLDFRVLYNYYDKVNSKNSLYSIIGELAKMNEMIFHPLTSYISFNGRTSERAPIDDLFKPLTTLDFQSTSPVFIMQYVGKNSSYQYENQNHLPDIVKIDFSGEGRFTSPSKSPFIDAQGDESINGPVAFFVDMGIKNQNMFRGISLDQAEFRETNESITVWDQLTSQKENRSIQTIGNNIYPILSRRSYTCKVESLGNMMIQPTMYFYLRYIPLFSGLYLITKVSHSIQPNNVVTNFEGVRMSSLNFPLVSEFVSTITKEILEKGAGTVTPYLTNQDPNWWTNLKDVALRNRVITFYNTIKTKINNPAVQASLIAIAYKESRLVPQNESSYARTSKFSTFNSFTNLKPYTTEGPNGIETSQFINELKKKDTTFFNFVYGNKNGNDPKTAKLNPINITDSNGKVITVYDDVNGDGYKYRGRGYNQITGKSLYSQAKKDTGVDVISNPDLLNNIDTAALALLGYFERGSTGSVRQSTNKENLFYQVYSKTPLKDYVPTDYQKAYNTLFSINAGPGYSMEVHLSNDIKKKGYNDGYFVLQSIYNAIVANEIK